MTGGHVLVESLDSVCSRHLAILLVHVVCAAAGVVTDPDAKVLDLCGPLFGDLIQCVSPVHLVPPSSAIPTHLVQADNLAVCLLHLAELREEVPEAGLCDDIVGRKDAHAVELRGGSVLGRQQSADDLVFLKATFG